MDYTTYILYSASIDKYYIGYSSSFMERFKYHNDSNRNRIWTKRGIPWKEFLRIDGLEKSMARKLELHLKKMKSRKYLEELKANPQLMHELISKIG